MNCIVNNTINPGDTINQKHIQNKGETMMSNIVDSNNTVKNLNVSLFVIPLKDFNFLSTLKNLIFNKKILDKIKTLNTNKKACFVVVVIDDYIVVAIDLLSDTEIEAIYKKENLKYVCFNAIIMGVKFKHDHGALVDHEKIKRYLESSDEFFNIITHALDNEEEVLNKILHESSKNRSMILRVYEMFPKIAEKIIFYTGIVSLLQELSTEEMAILLLKDFRFLIDILTQRETLEHDALVNLKETDKRKIEQLYWLTNMPFIEKDQYIQKLQFVLKNILEKI